MLCVCGGVFHKVLVKLGIGEPVQETVDHTLIAWSRSLSQMHHDADIVFFGDSLTEQSDVQSYFTDVDIVELGLGGDTIVTLKNRADMVSAVTPEKIFVLVGIDRLKQEDQRLFENGYMNADHTKDGVHLKEEGYDIWAEIVKPYIYG